MKTVTYKCNLCFDVMQKEDVVALYWKANCTPQTYVLNKLIDATDKHICKNCIKLIIESNQ